MDRSFPTQMEQFYQPSLCTPWFGQVDKHAGGIIARTVIRTKDLKARALPCS